MRYVDVKRGKDGKLYKVEIIPGGAEIYREVNGEWEKIKRGSKKRVLCEQFDSTPEYDDAKHFCHTFIVVGMWWAAEDE